MKLYVFLGSKVEIPRVRVGKRQTIEALITEETLLFTNFLRNEDKTLTPRVGAIL